VGVSHLVSMCVCVSLCVYVGYAGVATCIADDAIRCPNAAPTAKYAPVVVFTPSSKRAWVSLIPLLCLLLALVMGLALVSVVVALLAPLLLPLPLPALAKQC